MDPKLWKIWSKASANKSQIIWFLIYKYKAQFLRQDSDDLSRQSNAPDNSNLAASMDYYTPRLRP
jgi:hypothetical protein